MTQEPVKQILVVDDHFEMLEFLRSMLAMVNQDYQVLAVPSAEEGLMELRRTPFDLLITDVRLPGMSGFELVRLVRQVRPETRVIMITAYSSDQGKEEAAALDVFRYFTKPLQTDALLAAVQAALGEERAVSPEAAEAAPVPGLGAAVNRRLQTLRADTGAVKLILANVGGEILFEEGEQRGVDTRRLTELVAANVGNSLLLAQEMKSEEPVMIHYQAGAGLDLYSANVGVGHVLMLLFDVQARRGRIGTVWIFAQRAVGELKEILGATQGTAEPARETSRRESSAGTGERAAAQQTEHAAPGRPSQPEKEAPQRAHAPPQAEEAPPEVDSRELLEALGLDEEEAAEVDLDSFWESGFKGAAGGTGSGLSFEDAIREGLIPPDLNLPEE